MKQNLPDFIESECSRRNEDQSLFHVIPVPLEASVSYGTGTAKGPAAILDASLQLEAWDGNSIPAESGIHTTPVVDCTGTIDSTLDLIQARVGKSLAAGAIPVILGGEHTVTLGALRAVRSILKKPFGVVQLDAHADLRDEYEGEPFSHACVMRRAVETLDIPLFQIGVRAMCMEEYHARDRFGVRYLDARTLYESGIPLQVLPQDFPTDIYLTLDVDGLDPSLIRATGTPVPGGILWYDALTLIERCLYGRRLAGFDVVELAPQPGDHASDFAAAHLVYSVMGMAIRQTVAK
ncbi:MAG: agmatinase [Desulfobacteraceae bacterium]|nr:MAG: agmatinase [Desulfobacteraceae bacterium]